MMLDVSAQFVPVLSGTIGVLLGVVAALLIQVDREIAERYCPASNPLIGIAPKIALFIACVLLRQVDR